MATANRTYHLLVQGWDRRGKLKEQLVLETRSARRPLVRAAALRAEGYARKHRFKCVALSPQELDEGVVAAWHLMGGPTLLWRVAVEECRADQAGCGGLCLSRLPDGQATGEGLAEAEAADGGSE